MARCFDHTRRAGRLEAIAAYEAELAAILNGTWPRDVNDDMRWGSGRTFYDRAQKAAYVRGCLENHLTYLRAIPARIAAGELPGWEA